MFVHVCGNQFAAITVCVKGRVKQRSLFLSGEDTWFCGDSDLHNSPPSNKSKIFTNKIIIAYLVKGDGDSSPAYA